MATVTGVSRHDPPVSKDRSWRAQLPRGGDRAGTAEQTDGRTRRILSLAAVLLGLSAAIASSAPHQDHDVALRSADRLRVGGRASGMRRS